MSETGQISDGYHTFDELYHHRCLLFAALLGAYPSMSWKSRLHFDATEYKDWFIAGLDLPTGQITYHLPAWMWKMTRARIVPKAPSWDGHTSEDVCTRLQAWIERVD